MPDYPGAEAAIETRLKTGWTQTLIAFVNKQPPPPFPPIDPVTEKQAPCIVLELAGSDSNVATFGDPGNRFYRYSGVILIHALVRIDDGTANARAIAVAAAEIFRSALFYQDANGSYVRTGAPNPPDAGGKAEIDGVQVGNSYRVTCSVPFEYFHRA